MLKKTRGLVLFALVLCLVLVNCTKKEPPCPIKGPSEHAYLKAGPIEGGVLLPNGLSITPAGEQIKVGGFPMNLVLTPDNKTLIVTNNGYGIEKTQSLSVIDVDVRKMTIRQTVSKGSDESYFLGLAVKSDGTKLYASGGGNNKVWVYDIAGGELTNETYIPVRGYPGALTLSQDEKLLYVAQNLANKIAVVDLTISSPTVTSTTEVGQYPYDIVLTKDESKAYVSNWGERTVSVVDTSGHQVINTITVGKNPEDMVLSPDGKRLYVANSDTDDISVINVETDKVIDTISVDLRSDAPMGSSPNALCLSPDGKTLYVASAGTNSIDVISTEESKLLGRIPTGWYPTGVTINKDNSILFIVSAKGVGSGPNPEAEYVGGMMLGT
ncbi:MAG: beta-propeller fold lactonase family protein, partial [Deltaproteobacteria bacterium]